MEKFPPLKVGDKVIRGPDWFWDDQDRREGNKPDSRGNYVGIVSKITFTKKEYGRFDIVVNWCPEKRKEGHLGYYYNKNKHDVILYSRQPQKEVP